MKQSRFVFYQLLFVLIIGLQAVQAQGGLDIEYTVELKDPATQQFHITTDIKNINQPRLDLSLPTWTPGWYTVENYGKNLLRFTIKDEKGRRLPFTMSKKQTWNVVTRGIKQIRIEYDYVATILALNQAKITKDFAFFTGIELFLQPEGHRSTPSTLQFRIPAGWKLITPLKATDDPMKFIAADYDTLVDAPAQMGNFDLTTFEVDGKPHYFVANPAGAFSAEKTKQFTDMLAKIALTQKQIFGDLPYDKYVYYYFFSPPESNASGALEHLNSFVAFAPPGDVARPEQLIWTASHEFFHLWNVKRFRPAEMVPYDYSRENETPLLWVSEGLTNYYENVSVYRAGLATEAEFLAQAAGAAAGIENNEARKYISPANASVSTWVGYDSPVAFGISYYTAGENLGSLLDLSIRNDTDGRSSLDDVMRALYNDFYKKGKGFTTADMIAIINRLTKKDYNDFFARHIFDVQVPDYDRIFGYAGLQLKKEPRTGAVLGFNSRYRNGGLMIMSVEPASPAAAAGLQNGDIILKINGTDVRNTNFNDLAGKDVKLTLIRAGDQTEIAMTVGTRPYEFFTLTELPNASARQKTIKDGWMKRPAAAARAAH